jgi:hypothetical protein
MGVDGANPDEAPPLQKAPPPEFEKMKEIATSHAHKLCLQPFLAACPSGMVQSGSHLVHGASLKQQ